MAAGLFGSAKDHEAATTKEIRASEARAAAIEKEILAAEAAKVAAKDEAERKRKLAELEEQLYQERKKQIMALAKEQCVDISRCYLQTSDPDWADGLDGPIVVVERPDCWEVQFSLTQDRSADTAVVRIAKDSMQPVGMFHE